MDVAVPRERADKLQTLDVARWAEIPGTIHWDRGGAPARASWSPPGKVDGAETVSRFTFQGDSQVPVPRSIRDTPVPGYQQEEEAAQVWMGDCDV